MHHLKPFHVQKPTKCIAIIQTNARIASLKKINNVKHENLPPPEKSENQKMKNKFKNEIKKKKTRKTFFLCRL